VITVYDAEGNENDMDWQEEDEEDEQEEEPDDEDAGEEASTEDSDLLDQRLREVERAQRWNEEYAEKNLSKEKAEIFLQQQVDMDQLRREVTELQDEHKKQREEIQSQVTSGEISEFKAEILLSKIREKEKSMLWRLSLASAGMVPGDLGAVADEYYNLLSDSVDPETKEMRSDIKEKMVDMTPSQRKAYILKRYEEGKIDRSQCLFLLTEFM
jgi:uncharacterized protein with gpF-like domain